MGPGSEFSTIGLDVKITDDGNRIGIKVKHCPNKPEESTLANNYYDYLRRFISPPHVMKGVTTPGFHSFICENFGHGSQGLQGRVMMHLWRLVVGAMLVSWRNMPLFCDFLQRTVGAPQPNERPRLSLAAGGGPGRAQEAPAPSSGKRPAPEASGGGAGQGAGKKIRSDYSDLFAVCNTQMECVDEFKKHFPDVVDFYSVGGYSQKTDAHKNMIEKFVHRMEEIWISQIDPSKSYPFHDNLNGLSNLVQHCNLDTMLRFLFSPSRKFLLQPANFTFILPAISKCLENDAWTVKSDAHISELKQMLPLDLKYAMDVAWEKKQGSDTQKISMNYRLTSMGIEWRILFGINRRGPVADHEMEVLKRDPHNYVITDGYVWDKTGEIFVPIVFTNAGHVQITVTPRFGFDNFARLPTHLADLVARRCQRDCIVGPWPIMTSADVRGSVSMRVRHYPYMLDKYHILSVLTTLMAVVTNDKSQLNTDGPSIFQQGGPAGDGGPGN